MSSKKIKTRFRGLKIKDNFNKSVVFVGIILDFLIIYGLFRQQLTRFNHVAEDGGMPMLPGGGDTPTPGVSPVTRARSRTNQF